MVNKIVCTAASLDNDTVSDISNLLWLSVNHGYILSTAVCLGFFSITGFCANSLTFYVIVRSQRTLTIQNILVLLLLLLNLVHCLFSLPLYVYDTYLPGPQFSGPLCFIHGSAMFLVSGAHLFTLFMISLHRCFMVVHAQSKYLSFGGRGRTALIICVTLGINLSLFLPPLVGFWGRFVYVGPWGICTLTPEGPDGSYRTFMFVTAFALPFNAIVYCYVRIIIVVRKQRKLLNSSISGLKPADKRHRKRVNLTFITMAITFCFCLTYLPGLLTAFVPGLDTIGFNTFSGAIRWCHVVLDPLIYSLGDPEIEDIFHKVIMSDNSPRRTASTPVPNSH